jgi:hypothetical protein
VRLDHLLSKEHSEPQGSVEHHCLHATCHYFGGEVDVGWLLRVEHRLVDRHRASALVPLALSGWNAFGVRGGLGTLLGPEGAGDASRSVLQRRPHQLLVGVVVVRLGLARHHNALRSLRVVGVVGCQCGLVLPVA